MAVRFYLNDFTMCADINWDASVYPQKGDIILLKEFINLKKGESNVKFFTDYAGKCGVFNVSQGDRHSDNEYVMVKNIETVIVSTDKIWRVINGVQTACYLVKTKECFDILDAKFPNEQMN